MKEKIFWAYIPASKVYCPKCGLRLREGKTLNSANVLVCKRKHWWSWEFVGNGLNLQEEVME